MEISYKELLSREEWTQKRKEILERDNYTCKRCGINKDFKFRWKGVIIDKDSLSDKKYAFFKPSNLNTNIIKIKNENNELVCKTNLNAINFSNNNKYLISLNVGIRGKIDYSYNGATTKRGEFNIFTKPNCNREVLENLSNNLKSNSFEVDKEGFWFFELEREYEFLKKATFHVHHKCYRKNIEIWAQCNSEYETLCSSCHRIVHENQKVPFYDENGNLFSELVPCARCGGQKYFDCYKHVDGGVCFQCNGFGFTK